MTVWKAFQYDMKKVYDFDDIDMPLYYKYTEWLKGRDYCFNTVGKHIKTLKAILRCAESEGYRMLDCAVLDGNLLRAVNFINDEWPLIEGNVGRQREVRDFIGKYDAFCNAVMEFDSQCKVNESAAYDVLGNFEASRDYVIVASKYCEGLRKVTEDLDAISSGRGKKTTPLQGLAGEMSGYFNGLTDSDLEDALLHNKFIGHKGDWTEHVNKATYFGNHFGVSAEVMDRIFRFHGKDGHPTLAPFTRNPYPIGYKNDKLVEILAKYPRKEK